MIYGYFDESREQDEGYVVVAGFIGNKRSWKNYVRLWNDVLQGQALHMKALRLGGDKAERRWKDRLERLGAIPKQVGLRPFVGSVRTKDYKHLIEGTSAELVLSGYGIALLAMLGAIFASDLPPHRIELLFEEQIEHAVNRERAISFFRDSHDLTNRHGLSRIAKSSSIQKSMILEASDYLSYAVLYQLIDPDSQKARLTSPILRAYGEKIPHGHASEQQMKSLIEDFTEQGGGLDQMDKDRKAYIKEMLKKDLEGGMKWTKAIISTEQ